MEDNTLLSKGDEKMPNIGLPEHKLVELDRFIDTIHEGEDTENPRMRRPSIYSNKRSDEIKSRREAIGKLSKTLSSELSSSVSALSVLAALRKSPAEKSAESKNSPLTEVRTITTPVTETKSTERILKDTPRNAKLADIPETDSLPKSSSSVATSGPAKSIGSDLLSDSGNLFNSSINPVTSSTYKRDDDPIENSPRDVLKDKYQKVIDIRIEDLWTDQVEKDFRDLAHRCEIFAYQCLSASTFKRNLNTFITIILFICSSSTVFDNIGNLSQYITDYGLLVLGLILLICLTIQRVFALETMAAIEYNVYTEFLKLRKKMLIELKKKRYLRKDPYTLMMYIDTRSRDLMRDIQLIPDRQKMIHEIEREKKEELELEKIDGKAINEDQTRQEIYVEKDGVILAVPVSQKAQETTTVGEGIDLAFNEDCA